MRWFSAILAGSLFAAGSLAAKKSNGDRFEEFHVKALSSTPVKITDASYGKLTNAPRDYTAIVLLTALESRFGCGMCRDFQPEWDLLARSWTRGDKAGESRLVFGTLDFADGRDTFMAVGAKLLWTRALLLENALLTAADPCSSASKPLRSSSCSHPLQARTPLPLLSPFDSILPAGMEPPPNP